MIECHPLIKLFLSVFMLYDYMILLIVVIKYIIWCNLNFRNLIENCVANSCDIQEWWKPSESVKLDIRSGTCSRTLWIATESSPRASDHPTKRTAGPPPTKSALWCSVGETTRLANPKSSSRYLMLLVLWSECFIHLHLQNQENKNLPQGIWYLLCCALVFHSFTHMVLSGYRTKKIKLFFKVFYAGFECCKWQIWTFHSLTCIIFENNFLIYTSNQWLSHPLCQNTRKMTHNGKFISMHH